MDRRLPPGNPQQTVSHSIPYVDLMSIDEQESPEVEREPCNDPIGGRRVTTAGYPVPGLLNGTASVVVQRHILRIIKPGSSRRADVASRQFTVYHIAQKYLDVADQLHEGGIEFDSPGVFIYDSGVGCSLRIGVESGRRYPQLQFTALHLSKHLLILGGAALVRVMKRVERRIGPTLHHETSRSRCAAESTGG